MKIKKLIQNYYYGTPNKRDFTDDDLPETRIELFKEVFKSRKESMLLLNLIYFAIWIPAVVWSGINLIPLLYAEINDMVSYMFTYLLFLFPALAITGPFNAGVSFVSRNWARDEHNFVVSDFVYGMKANWKQALVLSTIQGAVPLLFCVGCYSYICIAEKYPACWLLLGIFVLLAALWSAAVQLMPTLMVTYELSVFAIIKNAILLTLTTLPRAIGIKLLTLALPFLTLLCLLFYPAAFVPIGAATIAAYLLFMLSLNKLIAASFANYACETYLNPRIEGARVNIGLRKRKG